MNNITPHPPGQEWNAGNYAHNADFVPKMGSDVIKLLSPQPGQRILELGCGDPDRASERAWRRCSGGG